LGTGEVFGYPLFAGGHPRASSAEAVIDCEVYKIPKVFVNRAMRRPEVALEMAALLELRLIEYEEMIGCLLPRRTKARLAKLLPILARRFGEPTGGGTAIGLRLTRTDLAAMTASTRESTNAAVSGLREKGILAMDAGRVVILDPERLAEVGRR
jgi:CRP/FNR family transcriptional regulator, global nitrogen regulator